VYQFTWKDDTLRLGSKRGTLISGRTDLTLAARLCYRRAHRHSIRANPAPTMQCPACKTENDVDRTSCIRCEAVLPPLLPAKTSRRRSRGRSSEKHADIPISPFAAKCNRDVFRAYRLSLFGVIPFLGLVLGPLAVFMASRILRKARDDPDFSAQAHAYASIFLGTLSAATNWIGLALMLLGLYLG
jgi:hypothetical protein